MGFDLSEFMQIFFDEGAEHLSQMESLLVNLNVDAPDPEQLNAIFRAAHSVKGAAATFGFTDIASVTHILENQLDRIRRGTLQLRQDMVDLFLEAADTLRCMINAHQQGQEPDLHASESLCSRLHAMEEEIAPSSPPPQEQSLAQHPGTARLVVYVNKIAHGQHASLCTMLAATDWQLVSETPELLTFEQFDEVNYAALAEALSFYLEPDAYTFGTGNGAEEVGLFEPQPSTPAEDMGLFESLPATAAEDMGLFEPLPATPAEDMGLFEPLPATPAEDMGLFEPLPPTPAEDMGLFEPLPEKKATAALAATTANLPEATRPTVSSKSTVQATEATSIRVATEKIDEQINLVGELVITHAMLIEATSHLDPGENEKLFASLALLERNTRALQESAMSIRMMPISTVFSRFPRVVRETANKLGKKVLLVTHGEQTELDRGLIEKLSDPLTHLVRNSLDHGIEASSEREAKGKDASGTLTLKAFHQGGNIVIEVRDDGAGLNRTKIINTARNRGFTIDDQAPDAEVWALIFEPGFSTADAVTDVSGRGVGMDVVKRNIQSMGGRIDIESHKDIGTTMTIRLPLTLAILDGMAIRHGRETYIIPLGFIVESLRPQSEDIRTLANRGKVLHVRGEYLPIVELRQIFGGIGQARSEGHDMFVILESAQGKTALRVDELLGQHQVVIKSLESNFRKLPGLSGATIMGDGHVALIIDVDSLVKMSQHTAEAQASQLEQLAG
ncbi:chemotaxis protein CheA [Chitinimonas prasina]|uniref:Chemotaxis protein CheA n=1 Tax=Chitinimonas prasina TaxID=1434937 RepID=A0ABQ5YIX5_9NEIS|nr:chemotaxis protein CheW [Chitinimonas prasina]GLR14970.1 chemotaxis protein CheA [Chitinimonas prasina]